jgi:hypothetical protein
MAQEIKKKRRIGVSIQGGIAYLFEGEGNPSEGTVNQLKSLNDTNAPIGSEYLDLLTGIKYIKIDTTPDNAGAHKTGSWAASGAPKDSLDAGIELTGAFAGKPLSNSYIWENGTGISITQAEVDAGIYKTFSLDRDVHLVVDTPYWTSPTPADHTDKGVFGGSYLPSDVPTVFDYVTVDSDTYEDGTNVVTTGGIDMSNFKVGDTIRVRFDFNCIPQIANTTIEPAIWYKNRDENDNVTFTFPLTATPIFYGTGTVGKSHLNRVEMSVYIASDEDINALAKFAIKSDNIVIIQPLSSLLTLVR